MIGENCEKPILKSIYSDFIVQESIATYNKGSAYHYYVLQKSGFTTLEAVTRITDFFDMDKSAITFAGLKDEDAITEQFIASERYFSEDELKKINTLLYEGDNKYACLRFWGNGAAPISIGHHNGNNFKIIVRGLSETFANTLKENKHRKFNFFFLNYFGPQRFGIPKKTKKNHLLGKYLLEEDYPNALQILKEIGVNESLQAEKYEGNSKEFFDQMDSRMLIFYKNSYCSFGWNQQLQGLVQIFSSGFYESSQDTISYTYPYNQEDILKVLLKSPTLDFNFYRYKDNKLDQKASPRPCAIQTQLVVHDVAADELHENCWAFSVSFFLPPGCYATVVLEQFIALMDCKKHEPSIIQ